ncbi:MAG: Ldh family oxidoreductase [Solirubrobacterales bacterium]|nr:Ldh family oxidoreductase [Solirubrobacterales bacterium]
MSATVVVDAQDERRVLEDTLVALGAGPAEAADQTLLLLEADLRGRHSHGIQRLPVIVERIRRGLLVPGERLSKSWAAEAFLAVDGAAGFGPHVAMRASDLIAERAARTGIAIAAIRNASHLGMLACYVEALAARGCIGVALTTSEALVHPQGGRQALIGTNPLAIAVPTDDEPFLLDMATGAISMGEILAYLERGAYLPRGRAVDREGHPTTDPAAAMQGAISPFGGGKGYSLGLGIELLVAALSGTALGQDVTGTLDVQHPASKGDVIIAVDVKSARLRPFTVRISDYLRLLRTSERAAGSSGIAVPGDRSRMTRLERLQSGIPLPERVWSQVQRLHAETTEAARTCA